jgi:hypothetical protein
VEKPLLYTEEPIFHMITTLLVAAAVVAVACGTASGNVG